MLLILHTAVFTFSYFAAGAGVDAGIGVGLLVVFFTLPLALYEIFLGVLSLAGEQGRIPGSIALKITSTVLLFAIYKSVEPQVIYGFLVHNAGRALPTFSGGQATSSQHAGSSARLPG
ncbi:hypothetical protein [Arthrobacter sp. PAMC25564]|uniref:hypothetical protein n=1 Tax=Arthrobacter sp. PAMC25564 TaxID=2565366 RepID=UPI001F10DA72|nr:hypothetical protein [Arthrobacter sp. PAMC25564]